jgi:hypothetical protein
VRLGELAAEVLPPGVLNVVCGDRSTGAAMTDHDIPAMVAITGSVAAGKAVAAAAAPRVKRVHLELGGNAPVVVFEDADVAAAAADIAVAGFFNAGQDCTAATRVIAHESIAVELADALAAEAAAVRFSRDETEGSEDFFIPPLNNADQMAKVSGLVSRVPSSARVLCGGSPADGAGWFYPPTVVAGVAHEDEIVQTGDLRAGDHRAVVRVGGGGHRGGQRHVVRAGVQRVDERPLPRGAAVEGAGLRLRVGELPHPARRRDAARRVQGERLRQGPLGLLAGGLHPRQARDVEVRVGGC